MADDERRAEIDDEVQAGRRTVETVLGPLKVVPECKTQAVCVNGLTCWEAGRCLRSPERDTEKP